MASIEAMKTAALATQNVSQEPSLLEGAEIEVTSASRVITATSKHEVLVRCWNDGESND
ncbi:hypothetical protein [Roseateles noduli]|uniref:hypothetical protein n=1 Tax=Roseateles noduli TaxID=2052484 RepID=UPI003D658DF3